MSVFQRHQMHLPIRLPNGFADPTTHPARRRAGYDLRNPGHQSRSSWLCLPRSHERSHLHVLPQDLYICPQSSHKQPDALQHAHRHTRKYLCRRIQAGVVQIRLCRTTDRALDHLQLQTVEQHHHLYPRIERATASLHRRGRHIHIRLAHGDLFIADSCRR